MDRLTLTADKVQGLIEVLVFHPKGELDLGTLPKLKKAIDRAVDSHELAVVIDLSGIDHADSSAITFLLNLPHKMARRFGFFLFAAPSVQMSYLLTIARAEKLLKAFPSVHHAVDHIFKSLPKRKFGESDPP